MTNDRSPKLPNGSSRLIKAWVNETIEAAPILRTKPKAITGHIMYNPPATAPVGTYSGPVIAATSGWITFFVAKPRLAKSAIRTRSVVAIFRVPLGKFWCG